jgi:hypothetical protein
MILHHRTSALFFFFPLFISFFCHSFQDSYWYFLHNGHALLRTTRRTLKKRIFFNYTTYKTIKIDQTDKNSTHESKNQVQRVFQDRDDNCVSFLFLVRAFSVTHVPFIIQLSFPSICFRRDNNWNYCASFLDRSHVNFCKEDLKNLVDMSNGFSSNSCICLANVSQSDVALFLREFY